MGETYCLNILMHNPQQIQIILSSQMRRYSPFFYEENSLQQSITFMINIDLFDCSRRENSFIIERISHETLSLCQPMVTCSQRNKTEAILFQQIKSLIFLLDLHHSDLLFFTILLINLSLFRCQYNYLNKIQIMDFWKKIKNYTYNERHCLGEGSFGKVYEGKSEEGVRVAVKKVEQRIISKDQYLRASLETEISIMKKLNHKNIVKLYDIVMTVNHIYLIMEFCGGGDLKRYCRNRKLPEEEAAEILRQICQGFQEIVKHGIIHRDLKPANILVHQGRFKICDFGFSKFFSDSSKMTRTCVGTPIYMSPQVLSQKSYTNKTDIWSLGVLYFELVFGKLPYYGNSEEELYKSIVKGKLQIPPCSKNTSYLLKNMLEIDESKRLGWNQLFEYYQLGQLQQDYRGEIFPPPHPAEIKSEQNLFYRQKAPSFDQVPQQHQNYIQGQVSTDAIYLNDSPKKQPERNYLKQQFSLDKDQSKDEEKKLQRKPKNPLAFQNVPPQTNIVNNSVHKMQNIHENKPAEDGENPRFYYFVLIQLIVNPIQGCESYPQFISTLYQETIDLYEKTLKRTKNPSYKKILQNELEQVKSIGTDVPNYKGASIKEDTQILIGELNSKMRTKQNISSIQWLQKLLIKDFTYINTKR